MTRNGTPSNVRWMVSIIVILLLTAWTLTPQLTTAKAWVAARPDALPHSFSELSQYPLEFQRAIFTALPASGKAQVMQERIQHALDHEQLTSKQRAFLVRVKHSVSPAIYGSDPVVKEQVAGMCLEGSELFVGRKVNYLTPDTVPEPIGLTTGWGVTMLRLQTQLRRLVQTYASSQEDCNCYTEAPWPLCTSCSFCQFWIIYGDRAADTDTICNPTPDGCGCF